MAFGNYYMGYQPGYYPGAVPDTLQQFKAPYQPQQPPQQGGNGLVWVQGEAGAKSYLVAPGNTVMLMDSEEQVFYLKSADASGMPMPLRAFVYTEKGAQPQAEAPKAFDPDRFVTREELEKRLADIVKKEDE